ncbi:MAG: T9SS type A sorting domain-containing protein, partial [Bacteroidota bacterium]
EDWSVNSVGPTCSRTVKCEYATGTWVEQSVQGTFVLGAPRIECGQSNTFYVACDGDVTDEWFCGTNLDGGGKPTSNVSTDAEIELVQNIYPNPFRNELTFTLQASKSTTAQLILSDLMGGKVIEEVVDLVGGDNRIHFNTSNVLPGAYTLSVIHDKTGELITAKQVVKQ